MQAASKVYAPVPSLNVLKFLRLQAQELSFFSSSIKAEVSRRSPHSFTAFFEHNASDSFCHPSESFGTSHQCRKTFESSLLNVDLFKRPRSHERVHAATLPVIFASTIHGKKPISLVRHASTQEPHLLRRLWAKRRRSHVAQKTEELPPLPSFLDDAGGTSLGRNKAGKAANELRLRCTEINENGDVTLVNGEFKKSELIAKVRKKQQTIRR